MTDYPRRAFAELRREVEQGFERSNGRGLHRRAIARCATLLSRRSGQFPRTRASAVWARKRAPS